MARRLTSGVRPHVTVRLASALLPLLVHAAALAQAPASAQPAEDPSPSELSRVELLDTIGSLHPPRSEEMVIPRNAPLRVRFRGRVVRPHWSPSVSSRPSIRLRFCTPWLEAPFQMLSIAEKAMTLPRSSTVT